MVIGSCEICGKAAEEDEIDPHGHFSSSDEDEHLSGRQDICHYAVDEDGDEPIVACGDYSSGGGASTNSSDVTCDGCLSTM